MANLTAVGKQLPKSIGRNHTTFWAKYGKDQEKKFLPDDVVPLVEPEGEISVALDPLCVSRVHDGLASGPDGNGFGQLGVTGLGHPRNLGRKVSYVVLLFLQRSL